MNPNIPGIEQLKELGLPAPVSYLPQTWGWWVLLGLLVMTALIIAARRYRQWHRDRYRREALVRLAQLQKRSDDLNALRELPELLKRVALSMPHAIPVGARLAREPGTAVPQVDRVIVLRGQVESSHRSLLQGVAALGGKDWQAFLQQHIAEPLPADFSQQLATLAYAPDATLRALPSEQRQHLFDTCILWVEHHHVAA